MGADPPPPALVPEAREDYFAVISERVVVAVFGTRQSQCCIYLYTCTINVYPTLLVKGARTNYQRKNNDTHVKPFLFF